MKLSRYARYYVLLIGVVSLLQVMLGGNLIVLLAIDLVSVAAVVPLSRPKFDPCDLLYLALCLYYGTLSLVLKTAVLQPVQMNLQAPLITSTYLVAGFGMISGAYVLVQRTMGSHYVGTRLRTWTTFERTYANIDFLERFTLPFSLLALAFVTLIAFTSHSAQEVANGFAKSSGFSTFGSLTPMIQLAMAMQLSLLTRKRSISARALVVLTLATGFTLSVLNDQKALVFELLVTAALHLVAYRIRIKPGTAITAILLTAFAFLYVSPVIHIIRGLQVEKSARLGESIRILQESNFNPFELIAFQNKLADSGGSASLASEVDYLAPNNYNTDRFTLLMPIDQMVRYENREPFGIAAYLSEIVNTTLPTFVVGEHSDALLSDQMAWRFSIRENNIIARPVLGFLATGYGVSGFLGLMLLGPFCVLVLFVLIKLFCNGSIWENPWAVYIGAMLFVYAEADVAVLQVLLRGFVPLMVLSWGMVKLHQFFDKKRAGSARLYSADH